MKQHKAIQVLAALCLVAGTTSGNAIQGTSTRIQHSTPKTGADKTAPKEEAQLNDGSFAFVKVIGGSVSAGGGGSGDGVGTGTGIVVTGGQSGTSFGTGTGSGSGSGAGFGFGFGSGNQG